MSDHTPSRGENVAWLWLIAMAAAHLVIQMATAGNYGMFRDEFYYLACANRLDWGYVDHPPFSIAALAAWTRTFGDSLLSIRLLAALVGSTTIVMTGLIAAGLGGRRFAQILAALAAALAPANLAIAGFYSMNAFDLALWTASFLVLIHIVNGGDRRLWLILGALLGIGLMNKVGVLVLGVGIGGGLLITRHRSHFRSRDLWYGAGIAALIFIPHILWQMANDWPTLEFIANAKRYKIAAYSPLEFFSEQIILMNPLFFPLWFAGLGFLLYSKRLAAHRILGVIFLIVFVVLVLQKSKPYYLVAAYAPLLAAGAIALEQVTRARLRFLRGIVAAVVVAAGSAIAPLAIPVLPVDTFIRYQSAIGLAASSGENNDTGSLPQTFADRFGWEEMTDAVVEVYNQLSPEEKAKCVIVTGNYGEAGAIEYYGRDRGLPG